MWDRCTFDDHNFRYGKFYPKFLMGNMTIEDQWEDQEQDGRT
jgi:hypothetical protein